MARLTQNNSLRHLFILPSKNNNGISFLKQWLLRDLEGEEMRTENKFIYTKPRQIPLFEEQDDGGLILHMQGE